MHYTARHSVILAMGIKGTQNEYSDFRGLVMKISILVFLFDFNFYIGLSTEYP